MMPGKASRSLFILFFVPCLLIPGAGRTVIAHCDTMDGPVVTAARAALTKGDITSVLKWVKPENEADVRDAFGRTLDVRKSGGAARDLADRWFFETLVRIHRQGEGAPYTGLKPSGAAPEAGIADADRALDKGSVDDLVRSMTAQMSAGLRERYARTMERREHAEASLQAGRDYVAAYVEFIHYVERLQQDIAATAGHHEDGHGGEPAHSR